MVAMTDTEILALVVSIITTGIAITAVQMKKVLYARFCQLASNSLLVLEYFITDNISASGVCAVAIIQVLTAFAFAKREGGYPKLLSVAFMLVYLTLTFFTIEKSADILSGVAACFFALAVIQRNMSVYRIFATSNCTTWLIFDIWSGTYTAVILHATLFTIDIITIIRKDRHFWRGIFEKIFRKKEKMSENE